MCFSSLASSAATMRQVNGDNAQYMYKDSQPHEIHSKHPLDSPGDVNETLGM